MPGRYYRLETMYHPDAGYDVDADKNFRAIVSMSDVIINESHIDNESQTFGITYSSLEEVKKDLVTAFPIKVGSVRCIGLSDSDNKSMEEFITGTRSGKITSADFDDIELNPLRRENIKNKLIDRNKLVDSELGEIENTSAVVDAQKED